MNYIAAIDAFHDLNPSQQFTAFMLDGKKAADDLNCQRLLIQSLLLSPPENRADKRLQQLQHSFRWYIHMIIFFHP